MTTISDHFAEEIRIASAMALRVTFPEGSSVTVAVADHRSVTRSGTPLTMMIVMGTIDGKIGNMSGWVGMVTGHPTPRVEVDPIHSGSRVIVKGYTEGAAAAHALVAKLAVEMYGREDALTPFVI